MISSDNTELIPRTPRTIPSGQSSITLDLFAVDDSIVDGTQTVTITASAAGHLDGSDTVDVTDDDLPAIFIGLDAPAIYEAGGKTNVLFARNFDLDSPMTLNLSSSDASSILLPSSVVVPAGEIQSSVEVFAIDDNLVDEGKSITLTLSDGVRDSPSVVLNVEDNDIPMLDVSVDVASIFENGTASRNCYAK
ncbi:MAG: hypothetical protein R3C05_02940 [Pirellulaceae bacterium]